MIDQIKNRFIKLLKRIFHYSGFTIQRVPNADQFIFEIDGAPLEVEKYELKKLVSNIKIANDQKLYNEILRKYVSAWDTNFINAKFKGKGRGVHNLCVYRKVCFDNSYYFEKVYFSDSCALLKIEWFYEYIYPIVKDHLNTAKLYKVIKGHFITIVYFEYIDFVPLPNDSWYPVFISTSKMMFDLSKKIGRRSENAPHYITDYRQHEWYKVCVKVADERIDELSDSKLSSTMIESIIDLQPLLFTHGDIHGMNVYSENCIIDWDSFGFYPHGFECAFIFANSVKPITYISLQEILVKEYKSLIHNVDWDGFELSLLYFYFLFSIKDEESTNNIKLQVDVYNRIESLYYKNVEALQIRS